MQARQESGSSRVAKTTRLVNLIYYLKDKRGGATAAQIRRDVTGYAQQQGDEAFRRQFARDRKELAQLGFALDVSTKSDGHTAVYQLDPYQNRQRDARLDSAEQALLSTCASAALDNPAFFLRNSLASAMAKLRDVAPLDIQNTLSDDSTVVTQDGAESGLSRTDSSTPANEPTGDQVAAAMEQARTRGLLMVFDYERGDGSVSQRRAYPLKAYWYAGQPYLFAYDADRSDARRFKFARIRRLEGFAPLSQEVEHDAHAVEELSPLLLPFQVGPQTFDATLYFSARIPASRVAALTMSIGRVQPHGAGTLWTVEACSMQRLAQWSVEMGPGILIVEPREAAQMVEQGLQRVAQGAASAAGDDGGAAQPDNHEAHAEGGDL